jgi:hypothetical protein
MAAGWPRKPPPFSGFRVDPLVIDPRRDHLDRAGAGEHLTRGVGAIAHDQSMPVLVAFVGEAGNVGVDLGLQRLGQHPAGTHTHDLVDQRRRRRCGIGGVVTVGGIRDYGEHRDVPSRPALPRRSSLEPSFGHPGRYALPEPIHRFQALLDATEGENLQDCRFSSFTALS